MAETTYPSLLSGPTTKEKRYDRQLRLWAASGQQALEEAHVLLVNPSLTDEQSGTALGTGVVGVEALKNLVLPGIGNYTIVDDATVSEEDLGVNFFLEEESLGKPRAAETCRLLQELNPDVNGNFKSESIESLLEEPDFLNSYSLILLIAPLFSETLEKICTIARQRSIPTFYIHCSGFYSAFSLQLPPKFPIVETHPEPESTQDLRLLKPWPELSKVTVPLSGLDDMEDHEHGHVPYILLLLHYLDKWKETHEGQLPENYKEKTAFKAMVGAGARADNAEGGEENFDEAVGAVMKSINAPSLGSNVREMFELQECGSPMIDSANFWITASAIKDFYGKHGVLPLPGSLPDMKAFSTEYIKLQNIYKHKARGDVAEVSGLVRGIEKQLKRKTPVPGQEVEAFCKNAAHIKIIHGSVMPVHGFLTPVSSKIAKKIVSSELQDTESLFTIWLAFSAFDAIVSKSPGTYSAKSLLNTQEWKKKLEEDVSLIYQQSQEEKSQDTVTVPEEVMERVLAVANEMQRSEGGELHNIASLTGGMVAQEAIKVVTRQYVPVDNTCIFDGVSSKTQVLKMGWA